jgi:hypothetical protein
MSFYKEIKSITENFTNFEGFNEIEINKLKLVKILTQFFKEYPNLVFFDISESIYDTFITIDPITIKDDKDQMFSIYQNKYFTNLEVKQQIYQEIKNLNLDLELILDALIDEGHTNPNAKMIVNFSKIGSGSFYFDRNFANEHFLEYLGTIQSKLNLIQEKNQLENSIHNKENKHNTIKM